MPVRSCTVRASQRSVGKQAELVEHLRAQQVRELPDLAAGSSSASSRADRDAGREAPSGPRGFLLEQLELDLQSAVSDWPTPSWRSREMRPRSSSCSAQHAARDATEAPLGLGEPLEQPSVLRRDPRDLLGDLAQPIAHGGRPDGLRATRRGRARAGRLRVRAGVEERVEVRAACPVAARAISRLRAGRLPRARPRSPAGCQDRAVQRVEPVETGAPSRAPPRRRALARAARRLRARPPRASSARASASAASMRRSACPSVLGLGERGRRAAAAPRPPAADAPAAIRARSADGLAAALPRERDAPATAPACALAASRRGRVPLGPAASPGRPPAPCSRSRAPRPPPASSALRRPAAARSSSSAACLSVNSASAALVVELPRHASASSKRLQRRAVAALVVVEDAEVAERDRRRRS